MLIKADEIKHDPMPTFTPQEVLKHIIEASGIDRSDLVGKLGSSDEVSEIIARISKDWDWIAGVRFDRVD